METTICAIKPGISRNQARCIISGVSGDFSPQVQRLVYYPYLWVHYVYTVKTFLGKRSIKAYILVDLLNNLASTADSFEHEDIAVDEEALIPFSVGKEKALETARTYLLHSSIHKMKTLLLPESRVQEERELYKPFWIVKCTDRDRLSFHVLVDALTGKYEILNLDGEKQ